MTEPQWTRKAEGVLSLDGTSLEIRLDERQWFQIYASDKRRSSAATLVAAKREAERIAGELREMGIPAPSMTDHTPTPLVTYGAFLRDMDGQQVGEMETPELAMRVALSVNNHDELVAALQQIEQLVDQAPVTTPDHEAVEIRSIARAAIKRATAEGSPAC